jgi:hypothetical protein
MAYIDRLEDLFDALTAEIDSGPTTVQPRPDLVYTLAMVRIILGGGTGGSGGGSGFTLGEYTAAVREAFETATTIDNLETLITQTNTLLTGLPGEMPIHSIASYRDAFREALELAASIDQLESLLSQSNTLLTNLPTAIPRYTLAEYTAAFRSSIETATNLDQVETLITSINNLATTINTRLGYLATESAEISTVLLASQNTQYSVVIPSGTKRIAFKCRACAALGDTVSDLYYSWVANRVIDSGTGLPSTSGEFDVLAIGSEESDQTYFATNRTLYLAAPVPAVAVTIRRWT